MWQVIPMSVEQTKAEIWIGHLKPLFWPAHAVHEFRLRYVGTEPPVPLARAAAATEPAEALAVEPTVSRPELSPENLAALRRAAAAARLVDRSGAKYVAISEWQHPLPNYESRAFQVSTLKDLDPNTHYQVALQTRVRGTGPGAWETLKFAEFLTLPTTLPAPDASRPFRVMVGSCYHEHHDDGRAALQYKRLWEQENERPSIKFLVGDQVYVDINPALVRLSTHDVRERVLDRYAEAWRELGSMLARGGAWMLPDDHEYFNNYPFTSGLVDQHLAHNSDYRETWTKVTKNAVRNIQQAQPLRTFDIGDGELSFCLLDVRSNRQPMYAMGFINWSILPAVLAWLQELRGPGVLVMSQLLMSSRGDGIDANLSNYHTQYAALVRAIGACGHDVVVLTGDVHFSRVSEATLPNKRKLIEVVSSPMSNLTDINSVSCNVPNQDPKHFPPHPITGVVQVPVKHVRASSTEPGGVPLFSTYWKTRSKENFVTVDFIKTSAGKVGMTVKAWLIREAPVGGIPAVDFKISYELE